MIKILLLVIAIGGAYCITKQGHFIEFKLKTNQTLPLEFQVEGAHLILYVKPSERIEALKESLELKHKKSTNSKKNDQDDEDDERNRLLVKKITSPGELHFNLKDGKNKTIDDVTVVDYFSSALFKDANKDGGSVSILLICKRGPCSGSVSAYGQGEEISLKGESEQEITFTKKIPVQLFTVTLPTKQDFSRFVVSLRSEGESLEKNNVHIDVYGEVKSTSHSMRERMFLEFDLTSSDNCDHCLVDLVICADNPSRKSLLVISLTQFEKETLLENNSPKIDFIGSLGQRNLYQFKLSSRYEVFQLRVTSFSHAVPRILANVDHRPDSLDKYQFNSQISGEIKGDQLSMLFRNQELDDKSILYVTLEGVITLYEIEFLKSRDDPVIKIDEFYVSQLLYSKVHTYLIKAFPAGEQNGLYLKVGAHQVSNDSQSKLKLYAKPCSQQFCTDGQFSADREKIQKQAQTPQDQANMFELVESNDGQDINFEPNCSSSEQDSDGYCWYAIAVESTKVKNSDQDDLQQLKIFPMFKSYFIYTQYTKGSIILRENIPFSSEIIEGDIHQLVYYYEPKEDDLSISFAISNANAEYMISISKQCNPVKKDCAKYSGGVDNQITFRGDDLRPGAYYIGVQGLITTQYCFSVTVLKTEGITVTKLQEGQSFRGQLQPGITNQDIAYFQFEVDFDKPTTKEVAYDTINPDIEVNIQGAKYKLAITVNPGSILPSMKSFDLISLNGFVSIQPNDEENYLRKGIYSVAVEFIQHDSLEEIDEHTTIPFSIVFTTSRTLRHLQLNSVFYDTILPLKNKTYFFVYGQSQLRQQIRNFYQKFKGLSCQVANSSDVQRSSSVSDAFELSIQGHHSSTYEINESLLEKLCQGSDSAQSEESKDQDIFNDYVCEIFVFIENHSTNKVSFSLSLWNPNSKMELFEGQPQQFNIDQIQNGNSLTFKYNPVSYVDDCQLIIQSYYGEITYTVSIQSKSKQLDEVWQDPQQYTAGQHNTHSKSIAPTAFDICKPNCVVLVQVKSLGVQGADVVDPQSIERTISYDDTFSIVVSQRFLEVYAGQHLELTVSASSPRYLIYPDVRDLVNDKENTLIVTLQEFVGRGQMCISISDDSFIRMPFKNTGTSCDFQVFGNTLELSSAQIVSLIEQEQLKVEDNLILIIEISSFSLSLQTQIAGKFEIFIEKSNNLNKELLLGSPYRLGMLENQNSTLSYFHYLNENIEVKIIRVSGFGYLTITRCLEDTATQCNEIVIQEKIFLSGQMQDSFTYSTTSKDFCYYCTYYLKFETAPQISLLGLITIITPTQFVKLSQGLTFIDSLCTDDQFNLYRVAFDTHHQTEATLKVYQGVPEMWIGFTASLLVEQYQFGPFDVEKFQKELSLDNNTSYFEAIIPPRQHLLDNEQKYNVSAMGNKENMLAAHFIEDDLYILIRSKVKQACNYSLIVTQGSNGAGSSLEDGVITQIVLNQLKPRISLFYYHLTATQPLLILKATENRLIPNLHQILDIETKFSPGNDHNQGDFSNMQPINLTFFTEHNGQVAYQLPLSTGLYQFTVVNLNADAKTKPNSPYFGFDKTGKIASPFLSNQYMFWLNFLDRLTLDVAVNSQEMFLLEPNSWIQGTIQPQQENFYELYIHQNGQIGISLQNCDGQLKFSYAQSYEAFLNQDYISSSRSQGGLTLDTLVNVKAGPLYIALHSESDTQSVYNLQTQIASQNVQLPHGKLMLGGDGEVSYTIHMDNPDIIDITFKPLKCLQCDLNVEENSKIVYEIVWATNEVNLNVLGKCGATQYFTQNKNNHEIYGSYKTMTYDLQSTMPITQEIDVDFQSESPQLFVSVRAIVLKYSGNDTNNYVILYQNTVITLPKNVLYLFKHKKEEFAVGIAIIIIFVIFMLSCLIYFCRRLRTLNKVKLDLELEKKMSKAIQEKTGTSTSKDGYGVFQDEQLEQGEANL